MTKRLKEENGSTGRNVNSSSGNNNNNNHNGTAGDSNVVSTTTGPMLPAGIPPGLTITSTSTNNTISNHHQHHNQHNHHQHPPQPSALTQGICLPQGVTIHVS